MNVYRTPASLPKNERVVDKPWPWWRILLDDILWWVSCPPAWTNWVTRLPLYFLAFLTINLVLAITGHTYVQINFIEPR